MDLGYLPRGLELHLPILQLQLPILLMHPASFILLKLNRYSTAFPKDPCLRFAWDRKRLPSFSPPFGSRLNACLLPGRLQLAQDQQLLRSLGEDQELLLRLLLH